MEINWNGKFLTHKIIFLVCFKFPFHFKLSFLFSYIVYFFLFPFQLSKFPYVKKISLQVGALITSHNMKFFYTSFFDFLKDFYTMILATELLPLFKKGSLDFIYAFEGA